MKKNLFVMAALAVLAIGCAKEQQPDVQNPADVNAKKTYLRVSVEDTKVAVNPLDGACSWQEGDVLKAYFRVKNADETFADVFVDFTCELKDGEAVFATTQEIPEEYERMILTTPAGEFVDGESDGGKKAGLVRNYVYDPDSVPVYARAYSWEQLPDGSFSAALTHNAAVLKFTLHDIPAYAAGFVLSNEAESVVVTTKFPYKTGYSEDIVLHSVFAHSHAPYCFYLIDGDGDEIEGSRKLFTPQEGYTSVPQVKAGQYIVFDKVVDFKKAELRKDYTVVGGVKWAKGNLQYDADAGQDGFQSGWRIAPYQWHNFKYAEASVQTPTRYDYTNSTEEYEHFNFGGVGRFPKFRTGNMKPSAVMDISGKVYSDINGQTEAVGDARFAVNNGTNATIWGDVAFWASKGTFRMPTNTEMKVLHNGSDKLLGCYKTPDGKIVWGVLFRTKWFGTRETNKTYDRVFTDADLESGLFLPNAGRRANSSSGSVISVTSQGAYRSSTYIGQKSGSELYYSSFYQADFTPDTGGPFAKLIDGLSSIGDAFDATAGFCVRPVLVEE